MREGQPRRDNLYYVANLIGLSVIGYRLVAILLQSALSAALDANLPGASAQNPVGIPVAAAALINCLATAVNLALPILWLRRSARPLALAPLALRRPGRVAAAALPLFLCYTTLCSVAANLMRMLLGLGGYVPPASTTLPEGAGPLALSFLSICVIPAIGEELFFRGTIQRLLTPYGDWFAIIVSSVLFALLHADLSQIPSIFALSLFLGYIVAAYGNVADAMLLHFFNNASGFLQLWARQQMDGTNVMALTAILFTFYFGAGLTVLIVLLRRRRPLPKLPRYPTRKNRMGRTERLLSAPFFTITLLLLILTCLMEYFR